MKQQYIYLKIHTKFFNYNAISEAVLKKNLPKHKAFMYIHVSLMFHYTTRLGHGFQCFQHTFHLILCLYSMKLFIQLTHGTNNAMEDNSHQKDRIQMKSTGDLFSFRCRICWRGGSFSYSLRDTMFAALDIYAVSVLSLLVFLG